MVSIAEIGSIKPERSCWMFPIIRHSQLTLVPMKFKY